MKRTILFIILVILSLFIKIPNYVELNNLAIIEAVGVSYKDAHYAVYLREIIPVKGEEGIDYEYKYYYDDGKSVEDAYKKILSKSRKKIYLNKARYIITNLKTSDRIKKSLGIKCNTIYHTIDDVYIKLKKTN